MGGIMETIIIVLQLCLDAAMLTLCCESVFRTRHTAKRKDLFLFPVLFVVCMASRSVITAGNEFHILFPLSGFELAPADNTVILLFLMLGVLLLNSLFYGAEDNGFVFCGTMTAFSVYLSVRSINVAFFALLGADGPMLSMGSRIGSVLFISILLFTPVFSWLQRALRSGSFTVRLISANIAIFMIMTLTVFSFDVTAFSAHMGITASLLLILLTADSVLLIFDQRRAQERRHIHMIEQYVPIVEELISQVRARQHEFNNRLLAIETAIDSANTLEEAKENISLLTQGLGINPNDQELLLCDSKIIAGMLFGKMKQAEASGVRMEMELHGLFKKGSVPETEWIELLGILLDNAIEASSGKDVIYIKSRQCEKYTELLVSNPFAALSNTEFMELFRKGTTTKKDSALHGFGLYNLMRITERYHGRIITRNESVDGRNYVVFGVLMP